MSGSEDRRAWMGVLAKAPAEPMRAAFAALGPEPGFTWLRAPETGTVMVRGRMGGTGAPFNLGEMTTTRCALRLADGTGGHAYVMGRDPEKARVAALCDALLRTEAAERVRDGVLVPMEALLARRRGTASARAATTKVEFFTLKRGED